MLAAVCVSGLLAGCGNSCFVAYSVNGNGGVIVKGGNPPPSCTLSQAQGMVRAALMRTPVCDQCAIVAPAQHLIVTLRGIQIHSKGNASDSEWLEIAPRLAASPLQFDLMGGSLSELSATSSTVPAGIYDFARLQFAALDDADRSLCGARIANCLMLEDGRIEALSLPGDEPEVSLPLTRDEKPLLVLPDTTSELQIRLVARQATLVPLSGANPLPMQLVGEVVREGIVLAN